MQISAIHTRPLLPPKDDLIEVLDAYLPALHEQSVIVISSKVVSIWQGRCVEIPEGTDRSTFKDALVRAEADQYLPRGNGVAGLRLHTIKDGVMIGSAGIDCSNGNGYAILWPMDAMDTADSIRAHLMEKHSVTELGVLISDSHSVPMRNGVSGITLGYAGFAPLTDYRGTNDIFGNKLRAERLNVADSIATATNLVMGEGDECTPLAIVTDVPHMTFADVSTVDDPHMRLFVPQHEDIFGIFFADVPWRDRDGGYNNTKE